MWFLFSMFRHQLPHSVMISPIGVATAEVLKGEQLSNCNCIIKHSLVHCILKLLKSVCDMNINMKLVLCFVRKLNIFLCVFDKHYKFTSNNKNIQCENYLQHQRIYSRKSKIVSIGSRVVSCCM